MAAGHIVTAAAVVLATADKSERYLYRGALVGDGFTPESIKHALAVGLIEKVKAPTAAEKSAAEKAAEDKAAADKLAAESK